MRRPVRTNSGVPGGAFQLADLAAQGLRRQVQLFGGTGDATEFGHLPEVVKLFVVGHHHQSMANISHNYIRLFLMKTLLQTCPLFFAGNG